VGLGLHDEGGLSLRGLEEARGADAVFAELYTSLMAGLSLGGLEGLVGKRISTVSRRMLEEEGGEAILQRAEVGRAALLVPGDPLIATTHVDLRIRAERRGIRTRVVHGASIVSAAMALSGLQNYKFGRSVTIPAPGETPISETPYNVVGENRKVGLHTLCFLDVRAEEERYVTVGEALRLLSAVEERRRRGVVTRDTLVVGVARAGSREPVVKAGFLEEVKSYEFGPPPHTLVFPGGLHFMEAEALITLAGAPESVRRLAR